MNESWTEKVQVAALFVETGGIYFSLPGVDPWDEKRDARLYDGTAPIAAHPPCGRWCKPLAKVNQTRYGYRIGNDGGCFAAALSALERCGGVLEHPAHSYAWDANYFSLPKPKRGEWLRSGQYWTTEISQSAYGHKARKRTWLLYVGKSPFSLDWSDPPGTHLTSWLQRTSRVAPRITKREADKTPLLFAELLVELARTV